MIVPPGAGRDRLAEVVAETVSLRDLPATVVDLLGLEADAPFPGESLARLWDAAAPPDPSPIPPLPDDRRPSPRWSRPILWIDDPAHLLAERPVWASLADGDSTYIRIRRGDRDEEACSTCATDPRQLHNLAADPAMQPPRADARDLGSDDGRAVDARAIQSLKRKSGE